MSGRLRGRRLWLSVAECAALLNIKPDTVRKRVYRGTLKARKFGGRWKVLASQVVNQRRREG